MTINIMVGEVDFEKKHKQILRGFDGIGLFVDSIDLLEEKSSIYVKRPKN